MSFIQEAETDVSLRYDGFGNAVFTELFNLQPQLRQSFSYYRNTDGTDAVWAIFSNEKFEYGVQLDPDTEVICVWDDSWHEEIGSWIPDPVSYTVKLILERYPVT